MKLTWLIAILFLPSAHGSMPCFDTAEEQQWAYYSNGGEYSESWKVEPGVIKTLSPPNGFALGIQIQPVSDDIYRKRLETRPIVPELVEVVWYDLSGEQPVRLRSVWGGSNSLQSYSTSSIDGTPPNSMDKAPFTLWLQKTNCVTLQDLESN